jgi:pimeloyl-ACP methyl ester carboxylesterase
MIRRSRSLIVLAALAFPTCQRCLAGETGALFAQVGPVSSPSALRRTAGQGRAVVLVHGLRWEPRNLICPPKQPIWLPELQSWQKPGSPTVVALAREGDVFAFAYGQHVPVTEVARAPLLLRKVQELRAAGYTEVVLVGHSAGGIIVRQFVEDHPDAGVTKVIQVCAPNRGCGLAAGSAVLGREWQTFVRSLSPEARERDLRARAGKRLPATVQFVCVVGSGLGQSDQVVGWSSIWSACLQRQNVSLVRTHRTHSTVMHRPDSVALLGRLVREPQPRWAQGRVALARQELFGK